MIDPLLPDKKMKSNYLSLYLADADYKTGVVHSKFSHTINVEFEDLLLNIGDFFSPLPCLGVRISSNKMQALLASCNIDDMVVYKQGKLYCYGSNQPIYIDLNQIQSVNLHLPLCSHYQHITNSVMFHALSQLEYAHLTGFDWEDIQFRQVIDGLKTMPLYSSEIKETMQYLIGRGKGLTPSGDDFLIGFLMVLKFYRIDTTTIDLFLTQQIVLRTTSVSIAYYRALFDGYISINFRYLFEHFLVSNEDKIQRIVKQIQRYGHTSGNDTLYGIYIGLEAISYHQDGYYN